jgi:hypothetical protein
MRVNQANFTKGEIGPELQARCDVDAYNAGLALARNVLVLKYGGVTRRPGTQLVAEVLDSANATTLLPFTFSQDQACVLEMGQGYMSPCADGGRILETELAIAGITNEAQCVLSVAYHGYAVGDRVYLANIAGAIGALLNGQAWQVLAVIDASHFRIGANTSQLGAFTGATGGVTNSAPPPAPTPPAVQAPVTPPSVPYNYGGASTFAYRNGAHLA